MTIDVCVPESLSPTEFGAAVGTELRRRRRGLGLRHRHLATPSLPAGLLRSVETGRAELTPGRLTELADAYGLDLAPLVAGRPVLCVKPDAIAIGSTTEPYAPGSLTAAVSAYLSVIERVGPPTPAGRPVRRDDVTRLADRLDLPCISVLSRLTDQMATSATRTRAMISLYLEGATVIGFR